MGHIYECEQGIPHFGCPACDEILRYGTADDAKPEPPTSSDEATEQ